VRALVLIVALAACKDKEPPPAPAPPPATAPVAKRSIIDEAAAAETIAAWDKAAAELDAKVAACADFTAECEEAALDAVQAHGRALALEHLTDPRSPMVPVPLPARAQTLIDACDVYVKRTKTGGGDVAEVALIAAREEWRYGWIDKATPRLEAIVIAFRDSKAAPLAVPLLLEGLRRQGKAADLKRWVDSLLADNKFLADNPELRELLEGLRAIPN
jgi:hypothetical protein